jgi:DNA-binding response OmpR family regulator
VKKTILIIEDDQDTSEMLGYLAELLKFDAVYSLVVLPLSEIQDLDPNLILLDHQLSGRLGGKLCLELKTSPETRHIPIIIISATSDLARIAKDSYADHFIEKPFDIDDLESSIKKYMS